MKKLQENQRKPKKTNKTFGKPTNSFYRFQTHPWIWVWSCLFCWFSQRFLENQKTFGKTKNTKENQNKLRENQTNKVVKGFRPTLRYGCGLVCCLVFQKPSGKTKRKTRPNPYPRVGLKPLNTLFFGFAEALFGCLWFSLVCLVFPNVCLVV